MAESRAVLIGNASGVKYMPELKDIPAVAHNIRELHAVLTDGTVWSLPPDNCVTLLQPESGEAVKRTLKKASEEASDTLLVYYAGHGLRAGSDDSLYLTLPHIEDSDEGLRYNDLRLRLQPPVRKGRRTVVILDCCYADLAGDGQMGGDGGGGAEFAKQAEIEGIGLFTAAAATRKALAPAGERHTAFTGELLNVLRLGDPKGSEYLDLNDVFLAVSHRLTERRKALPLLPEPRLRTKALGSRIVLARNGSYRAPRQLPKPPAPAPVLAPVPAPLPFDEIVTLCRAHKLRVPSDPNVTRKIVGKVLDEQVPAGEERLLAFYRWPWLLNSSRAIAVTTWGVRLRDGNRHLAVPYEDLGEYSAVSETYETAASPDGAIHTTTLTMSGQDRTYQFLEAAFQRGPNAETLAALMNLLKEIVAPHNAR
ncbi:caspase, EACC1-associated type [Streptomyces coelicoflavus]|uniref:caspase, EACC1-associated type n=1 Tax=Streptomyces coelicoflavus TaxID=285562 RepID=UPI00131EFA21|nr:caspase family protein [Streptomyces coelicoflavus]